jgi:glutamyl-tRNA synthetase
MTAEQTIEGLERSYETLSALSEFSHAAQEAAMRPLVEALGLKPGQLFGAIRVAVTGQPVSPPLFETMEILGKSVSLQRIQTAIGLLNGK